MWRLFLLNALVLEGRLFFTLILLKFPPLFSDISIFHGAHDGSKVHIYKPLINLKIYAKPSLKPVIPLMPSSTLVELRRFRI